MSTLKERKQCQRSTTKGRRCRNRASEGNTCLLHWQIFRRRLKGHGPLPAWYSRPRRRAGMGCQLTEKKTEAIQAALNAWVEDLLDITLTYDTVAERMRGMGFDPDDCELGEVMCAMRKLVRKGAPVEEDGGVAE